MIVCPNCGGNLKYKIDLGMMSCDACESTFDPYDFDEKDKDGVETQEYETTVFTCPQCGGEILSTDTDITGFCSYCGASTMFYSRMQKELKPDFIIPFAKTKEECKKAFSSVARKDPFCPREYRDTAYIDSFRGIYMPYWSYNADQKGKVMMRGEKSHRSGDYIIHEHYDLTGNLDAFYHGVSYDASSSFSDDVSSAIAPFDVKQKKPFTAGFLSGFYADSSDVAPNVYGKDVQSFADEHTESALKKIPEFRQYSVTVSRKNMHTEVKKPNRTLFPVWFMSYRRGDRVAYAAVNGQTGKVAADLPVDIGRFLVWSGVGALVLFAILNLLFTPTPRVGCAFAFIAALTTMIIYLVEIDSIKNREIRKDDKGYASSGIGDPKAGSKYSAKPLPIILLSITLVVCGLSFVLNFVYDTTYYVVDIFAAICIGISLIFPIKEYNILTTRPLPQFEKHGGDDNA